MALGASLVTGTGSTDGADYVNDLAAYAQPLVAGLQVENLGCGGETTTTMINGGTCTKYTTGSQLGDAEAFLKEHRGRVAFATIDIGADDVLGCTSGGTIHKACFESGLTRVEANLPLILAGLRAAGSAVPLVGMTYYDPYLASWLDGSSGQAEARESVRLVAQLDGALRAIYTRYGVTVASAFDRFKTNDFADTGSWDDQTVPVNVADICDWTWMCTPGGPTIHANDTGYVELAQAFEKVLVVPPSVGGTPPAATVGEHYTFAFVLRGIPRVTVIRHGALAAGMRLSGKGVLSGVPRRAGTHPFAVTVANGAGDTRTVSETLKAVGAAPSSSRHRTG